MKWPASERCLGFTADDFPLMIGVAAGPRSLVLKPWPLVSFRILASSSMVHRIQKRTRSDAASVIALQSSFATKYRGGVSPSEDHTSRVARVSGALATPRSHPGLFVCGSTFGQTILERLGQSCRISTVSPILACTSGLE